MNPVNPLTGNFDGVRYYRGVVEGSDPRRNSTALLSHPFINEAAVRSRPFLSHLQLNVPL